MPDLGIALVIILLHLIDAVVEVGRFTGISDEIQGGIGGARSTVLEMIGARVHCWRSLNFIVYYNAFHSSNTALANKSEGGIRV